ncbi:MAG: hypothetical protein A2342_04445 [Gallionellales bacterium RIFOXYB12_FULL_54_9]|nr:MAG: hypothetical protein A2342_04445 [Gallionellales bacterium RIFOXYB12_FULL_54_9]
MAGLSNKYAVMFKRRWSEMRASGDTHRRLIRKELNEIRGLIPLLMKHRNGQRWSADERTALLRDLRAVANLSPYLIPLLLPGGIFMLPLIACWMDYRRNLRKEQSRQDKLQ